MGFFFSKRKTVTREDQAVLDSKLTRDKIKAYIRRLEKNQQLKRQKAKAALGRGGRDLAKMYLTQSKMFSEQIVSANGQLAMIEDQIQRIETAQFQKEAFQVLEKGNMVLKNLYKEVNIEKWEKIADDMNEFKEQQEEVNNFFKERNIDQELEVGNELNELLEQENRPKEEDVISFPDVKVNEPNRKNNSQTNKETIMEN